MTNKKSGIPVSLLDLKEIKASTPGPLPAKKVEDPKLSFENQMRALELCRRKVNNYRQAEGVDRLIEECEEEALVMPKKMKKVAINAYSMLAFARQDDETLAALMITPIDELYRQVFNRFGLPKEEVERLCKGRGDIHQTTVEVNLFINGKIEESIARINNLPSSIQLRDLMIAADKHKYSEPLYSATDIRVRPLFYYGGLPLEDKIRVVNEIDVEYGQMLSKHTDKQHEDRTHKLREKCGIA